MRSSAPFWRWRRTFAIPPVLVGTSVLVGWFANIAWLRDLHPGWVSMKPNTALCLVLLGLALGTTDRPRWAIVRQAAVSLVGAIGALTVTEWIFGLNIGLDELIHRDVASAVTAAPGRMAITTASALLLLAIALWLTTSASAKSVAVAQYVAVGAFVFGLLSFAGYLYGASHTFAETFGLRAMAFHTSVLVMYLSVGILGLQPRSGPVSAITQRDPGGRLARRLLPAAIVVPLFLGWVRWVAQQKGLIGTQLGLTLYAVSNVVIFSVLVWLTARSLSLADTERTDALAALAWNKELLERDVARRQLAEEHLTRSVDRLEVLRSIANGILSAETREEIATVALEKLLPLARCDGGTVVLIEEETDSLHLIAVDRQASERLPVGTHLPMSAIDGFPGGLQAMRSPVPYFVDLMSLEDPSPAIQARISEGSRTVLIAPISSDGRMIGFLSLQKRSSEAPREDEMETASQVADSLAIALMQQHLRQQESLRTQLEDARREADRANMAKSDFLARMSHELRTPMNAIIGFAQLLELAETDPDNIDSLDQISKAGRHLLTLINEVLDITRIEAGALSLSVEAVGVDEVIAETIELLRPLATQEGISLAVRENGDERYALADRQRLKQILLNLGGNAIKYNRRAGSVFITVDDDAEHTSIFVRDTGHGISPAQAEKLFEPFERLGADQRGIEGTGLGLALSQGLAAAMHGEITVAATGEEGSTFRLVLQRADAPEPSLPIVAAEQTATAAPNGVQRTVLYIEDNPANLRLVEKIFRRRPGLQLLTSDEGRAGIELARTRAPALILLDMHLPDLDGEQVLAHLQQDPATASIPVVALSAEATRGTIERFLAAGGVDYITKPIDVSAFLRVVDSILGRSS